MTARNVALLWLVVFLVLISEHTTQTKDWPDFRGPAGQGHSSETGLPIEWSDSENIIWKSPVPGSGWSSPIVADGHVWLTTATHEPEGSLRLMAFNLDDGKPAIDVEVFRIDDLRSPNPKNSLASPSPVVDDDQVFVHFGATGTAGLTTTGEILWTRKFPYASQHGNGGSPILYKDLLIFSCDGFDTAFVIALDRNTGDVRWKVERETPVSQAYSTPLIVQVDDHDQLISVGAFRTAAYDPVTGKELWRVRYEDGFSNVPRPVYGHGLVYIATGFQVPSVIAVRANGSGDVTDSHIAWSLRRGAPLTPSPLLVGDELYLVNDYGIVTCVNAISGEQIWQERIGGNYSASPVFADGRIYFQSEEGKTTVIAPGTEYEFLGTNMMHASTLASMAVAQGSFLLRTADHLYRIGTHHSSN